MSTDKPEDWDVPAFREIASPSDMFGVPPEHFAVSVMLGAMPSLALICFSTYGKSLTAFLCSAGMAIVLIPTILFVLRSLYKSDNFWAEHLTSHLYPAERWMSQ